MINNKAVRRALISISLAMYLLVLTAFVYGEVVMAQAKNGLKLCPKCGETKEVGEFNNYNRSKDGLHCWCKDCFKQYREDHKEDAKRYREDNKEDAKKTRLIRCQKNKERNIKEGITIKEKRCTKCGVVKSADEFHKDYRTKNGLEGWCKDCKKKYQQGRVEKRKEYKKQYDQTHKKERAEYERIRCQTDITYRLNKNIRRVINRALKSKGGSKQGKRTKEILEILGYTIQDLINHLESQFKPGMSWDNYGKGPGKWHIDHKKPIKLFNFTSPDDEEFEQCWALSNLQPLWEEENLKKGAKWDVE